eukprot:RCo046500
MMRLRTLWGDRLHRQALHYAMTSFSASVLNNVFVTFYVQTFLTTFHLNQFWFMVGQVVYCVWNCTNDPVFGWIGDTRFQNAQQRRLPRIRVGGPLWALAFLVVWCPFTRDPVANPAIAGLHFIVAMVLYDGAMSYTMVAHQALLADLTSNDRQRERCNMYSAGCHIAGSFAVFAAHQAWESTSMGRFRVLAVGLSVVACLGFCCTSLSSHLTERYDGPASGHAHGVGAGVAPQNAGM